MQLLQAANGTWFRLDQVKELHVADARPDPSASCTVPYYRAVAVLEDGSTHPIGERDKNRDNSQLDIDRLARRINDAAREGM